MIAIANTATLTSTRMIEAALPSVDSRGILADAPADHAEDQLARPDRALQRKGDDEQAFTRRGDPRRKLGIGRDDVDRRR